MPVPIRLVMDKRDDSQNSFADFSMFLTPLLPPEKKKVLASNKDASLLFEIWSRGEKSTSDSIKIVPSLNLSSSDIMRLKTMGFITGNNEEVKITKKGRIVITTMVLGEESEFNKNKAKKTYSEILASMDKRNKPGYRIPKFASDNNNRLDLRNG